jgi:putative inorganic carbon (HCO3(-)) transporter
MERIKGLASRLAPLEIFIVSAGVLAGTLDERLLAPALSAAALFWIARWIARESWSVRTPADLAIILLVLAACGSLFVTVRSEITAPLVLKLFLSVAFFYALVNWATTENHIRLLQIGFVLLGIGLALIAPFSVDWVTSKVPLIPAAVYERFTLLIGDSVHRNVMAGYLLIFLSMILGWVIVGWQVYRPAGRAALIAAAVLIFTMLVLTQSRGALLALSVIVLAVIVMRFRRGWILAPLTIIAAGLVVRAYGVDEFITTFSSGVSLEGWEDRVRIWSRAIQMLQDFPVTGVGLGLFGSAADTLYPDYFSESGQLSHAHNLFLQVAVDLGIPGLIAWLALAALVFKNAWRLYLGGQSDGQPKIAALGVGLITAQLALVSHGLLDAVTWGDVKPAPIIWGIWAFAFAGSKVFLDPVAGVPVATNPEI